jgi:hypothetical protein
LTAIATTTKRIKGEEVVDSGQNLYLSIIALDVLFGKKSKMVNQEKGQIVKEFGFAIAVLAP